ncbi:MAG: PBSX family phage terminase large subunit [Nitrosomonadaceae bacterium]|nr:PBSX family phage terminase large subunit [Nitrosomonadaceae bacterium]
MEPRRYKVMYGGRGSGKSWAAARALVLQAYLEPLRVLCARETQKSINESVHELLKVQIAALGLDTEFVVQEQRILGRNGSEFAFAGLRQQGITNIKSFEGFDRVWVEEAQVVTRRSWEVLIPTIRKPGSEIWVTFNPELDTDETYKRFVSNPPADSWVQKVNWDANPWFPAVLEQERLYLKDRDPVAYRNIWEGECRPTVDGAIYAREMQLAGSQERIGRVPYEPSVLVSTYWDLGVGDSTAIWFAQHVNNEVRLIDYYEATGVGLPHYAEVIKTRGYHYNRHVAPHDINVRELGSGRSRLEIAQSLGICFDIAPKLSLEDGIAAARNLLLKCYFDKDKCADGINCLRHYRWDWNQRLDMAKPTPLHDWASHGADAFRYLAVAERAVAKPKPIAYPKMGYA